MIMHHDLVTAVVAERRRDLERTAARHRLARLVRPGRRAAVADRTAAAAPTPRRVFGSGRTPAQALTPLPVFAAGRGLDGAAPASGGPAGAGAAGSVASSGPVAQARPTRGRAVPCAEQPAACGSAA